MSINKIQTNLASISQNSTPIFNENEPFEKFLKSFRIYMRRDEKCSLVFNNPTGFGTTSQQTGESKEDFKSRRRLITQWESGNATIFSFLHQAIMTHNVRAANILSSLPGEGDGMAAIAALELEFQDQSIIKEDGQQLKLQYDNRRILPGETIIPFIEDINRLRLRLKDLQINLTDADVVTKILHSMATIENQAYAAIRDAIIASEDPSTGITLSSLIQRLRKIDSIRVGTLSSNPSVSTSISTNIQSSSATQPEQQPGESVHAIFNRKFNKQKSKTVKNFRRNNHILPK